MKRNKEKASFKAEKGTKGKKEIAHKGNSGNRLSIENKSKYPLVYVQYVHRYCRAGMFSTYSLNTVG